MPRKHSSSGNEGPALACELDRGLRAFDLMSSMLFNEQQEVGMERAPQSRALAALAGDLPLAPSTT